MLDGHGTHAHLDALQVRPYAPSLLTPATVAKLRKL
jgi:hypothetical protein